MLAKEVINPVASPRSFLIFDGKAEELKVITLEKFKFLTERQPTQSEIDEIIRYLHSRTKLDQIRIYQSEDQQMHLSTLLIPKIASIQFQGLSHISETEARNVMNLEVGEVFDQDQLIEAGERLRQYYKEQSYLNAVIDVELPRNAAQDIEVKFLVKENKRTVIAEITFETPNQELITKLKRGLRSHLNDPLSESQLSEIQKEMREIFSKNGYYRAQIIGPTFGYNEDESQVKLKYQIENYESYVFDFTGNVKETSSKIENILDLPNYYTSSPSLPQEISNRIRNYYLSQGYARVEIKSDEMDGRTAYTKRIIYTINEGPRVRISKIWINGRISRPESYYIDLLKDNSPSNIRSGYYSREDLETGFKNLIVQLQNEGFLTAKILSTKVNYEKEDRGLVQVQVNLDEGPQTYIDQITFEGRISYSERILLDQLKIGGKGDPLKLSALEQAILNLKTFYYENGYIEMVLINERDDLVRYSENNTKAQIHFRISEGPQVRVAQIQVEGNRMTNEKVILTELELKKGDLVTVSKIEESVARLQQTALFSSVEVKTIEEKTNVEQRTLIVRVKERDPGVFTMGFGATNENQLTLHGYTGVSYRNIGGWGRALFSRVEGNYNIADIKYLESKVTVGYLEPYLFETRARFKVNVTRSNTISDLDARKVTMLNYAVTTVEQDITSHVMVGYDILGVATYVDQGISPSDNVPRTDMVIASTGPSISIDYRDNQFNPTRGHFSKLNLEYSSENLGSSKVDEFVRTTATFTHYQPINKKGVLLSNSLRVGYLKDVKSYGYGVPYDKKGFSLGGRSTIRGYETGESFPTLKDLGGKTDYALFNDTYYRLFKSEMRIPLFGDWAMAVFYDGGSVQIENLDLPQWRHSAGLGIRYITPIGPVNLDFALKIDRRPGESTGAFHLSIGSF